MRKAHVILVMLALLGGRAVLGQEHSLYFDGTGYLEVTDVNFGQLDHLTLEAWAKPIDMGSGYEKVIFHFRLPDEPTSFNLFYYGHQDDDFMASRIQTSPRVDTNAGSITSGQWVHTAMAYDGEQMRMYLNGECMDSAYYNEPVYERIADLSMGGLSWGDPESGFNGHIDELRIWDSARSQQQIRSNMSNQLNGNEPGLIGYWPLNSGSGNNANDYSSSGNDMTIYGGTNWSEDLPPYSGPTWHISTTGSDETGDGSYSSFAAGHSISRTTGFSIEYGSGVDAWLNMSLGPDISVSSGGPGWSVGFNIETVIEVDVSSSYRQFQNYQREYLEVIEINEIFSTSGDDQVIGEGSDLYFGAAYNLIFGITEVLSWVDSLNSVAIDSSVMMRTDGFDTHYLYTENQIINTVIPNLEAIDDTLSVALWEGFLAENQYNRENPLSNPNHPNNLTFNAGATYSWEEATTHDTTITTEFSTFLSGEVGLSIGLLIGGIGGVGGASVTIQQRTGYPRTDSEEHRTAYSFTLADDDETSELNELADYFTVDIGKDPQYGTPVFTLISGASSCPWEEHTLPREGVDLTANFYEKNDVPAEEPALFILLLGNTSQSGEDRMYNLSVHQETNSTGATVYINGVPIEESMAFAVPGSGAVEAVMTIERGPESFELDSLVIEMSSVCDGGDGPPDHYFSMTKAFDVTWQAPYSRVAFIWPEPGLEWLINQTSGDQLPVRLTGYDTAHENLESLRLQYRLPPAINWTSAYEVPKDSLVAWGDTEYHDFNWVVAALADGEYQLRSTAFNGLHGEWASDPVNGIIDRQAPGLLSTPEPVDGVLEPDDLISVSFDEELDGDALHPDSVSVEIIRNGNPVNVNVAVFENTINLTLTDADFWIENELLRVRVNGVPDLSGNRGGLVEWEFLVNRSPVSWTDTGFEAVKPLGEPLEFCLELVNEGGQPAAFTITDLPVWLTAEPADGIIPALDALPVEFMVSEELGIGSYEAIIYADVSSLGREPLTVSIDVLPDPPGWAFTDFSNYTYSMDFVAQLEIDGELSQDLSDLVGAFVHTGEEWECRGVATVDHVDYLPPEYNAYLLFLTVFSDSPAGEELEFRTWNAARNLEFIGIEEDHQFAADALVGNQLAPVTFTVTGETLREIECAAGWSWISLNLADPSDNSPDLLLGDLNPTTDDLIKSQREYAQYVEGAGWLGSLDSLRTVDGYKLQLSTGETFDLTGLPVDPSLAPLTVISGWNWIGYTPQLSYSVNQALAGLPAPATGDLIKGQDGFALYIENEGWFGSLVFMHPGLGYMLQTENAGEFSYPGWGTRLMVTENLFPLPVKLRDAPDWSVDPAGYELTSSITAQVWRDDLPADSSLMVGAFVDGECRGVATPIYLLDSWLVFLTVYANTNGETINFDIYLESTDEILPAEESVLFVNNDILGTPLDPFLLHVNTAPEAPSAVSIAYSGNQLILSWTEVPAATTYRIYAAEDLYGDYLDVSSEGVFDFQQSVVTWTLSLPAEETGFYRVTSLSGREPLTGDLELRVVPVR